MTLRLSPGPAPVTTTLQRAASETGSSLGEVLSDSLGQRFGQDFSRVRVHNGPASAEAAQRLGARAYTLGTDIHLGAETRGMSGRELDRLLAHEAVHTVQQGARPAAPHAGLSVSNPADAAEKEASRIADSVGNRDAVPNSTRSATGTRMREPGIAQSVAPQLQRDLTGKKAVKDGEFEMKLKTESHPGDKSGLSGTIKFTPSDQAPDSDHLRLLQVVRTEDLATGKDYVWADGEADRNKVKTVAVPGVNAGYFVDQLYSGSKPRAQKTDALVSPYYIDNGNTGATDNYDGSKKGKTVKDASLYDYPGSGSNMRFNFETAAKASDTGYVYATLNWGFTLSDAAKGKVEREHATASRSPSATFGVALSNFNEFFKNPGSSKAP